MGFSVIASGQSSPALWRPLGLLMLPWQGPQGLSQVRGQCWETNSPKAACVSPTTAHSFIQQSYIVHRLCAGHLEALRIQLALTSSEVDIRETTGNEVHTQ